MAHRTIPQRELRNDIAAVLRAAEAGDTFTVTVRGRAVARLGPPGDPPERRVDVDRETLQRIAALPVDADLASDLDAAESMARSISQRELRNTSGEIMRALDRGESFVVTRNGAPVGDLTPVRRRRFVRAEDALTAFAGLPRIDFQRFREDIDAQLDQDPVPRA